MTPIVLVGPGGHCRSCIDVIESTGSFQIVAIVGKQDEIGQDILGHTIEYQDSDLGDLVKRHSNFLITVGQIRTSEPRRRLYEQIKQLGGEFPTIVSPKAYVARSARVSNGSIIMHAAIVNAGASVGANCIINTKALVEHDTTVGDHCHISTGAIVNGGVVVENDCFLGSGSVTHQAIRIPAGSVIGASTWVDKDGQAKRLKHGKT